MKILNLFIKNSLTKRSYISGIWFILMFLQASAQDLSNLNPKSLTYIDSLSLPDVFQTNLKSSTGGKLLDSVYYYDPDTKISEWVKTQSTLYKYNTGNFLSEKTSRYWSDQESQWKEFLKTETSYFPPGLKNDEITKAWNAENNTWENRMKNSYSYDSLNQLEYLVISYWNSESSEWKDSLRYTYGFDADGNWIRYHRETWISDSLSWNSNYRFFFSYENGIKTKLLRQNFKADSQVWINSNRIIYSYDPSNQMTSETGDVWDTDSSKWDKNSRIKYLYYETRNLSDKIYKFWGPEGWIHYARYHYSWDQQGNNINIVYSTWSSDASDWSENAAYQYEYDGDGDLIREIWKDFNPQNSEWVSTFRIDYFFSFTTIKHELPQTEVHVYPNPFQESLIIDLKTGFNNTDRIWLQITDLNGRILYTKLLQSEKNILTGLNLSSGIYLLRIQFREQMLYRKIVRN